MASVRRSASETKDAYIKKITCRLYNSTHRVEHLELALGIVLDELNGSLQMAYGFKKPDDLTAESILKDALTERGRHNIKLGEK